MKKSLSKAIGPIGKVESDNYTAFDERGTSYRGKNLSYGGR